MSRQTLGGEPKAGWFPEERLTIEEAIEAETKAPAWASFEEEIKGTITPGSSPTSRCSTRTSSKSAGANPARLLKAKVLYTIVGGKVVYQR